MRKELKIISLSEIKTEEVKWLWYPYIPFGKVTIVQGDPGEGKTTFVLSVIAALTRGDALPECEAGLPPMNVIYQTAEDGLADTIKPRLEAVGADCTRVRTIDDSRSMLTLTDQRLEEAIHSTDAGLLVLDPLQAYLGSGVDMHRANEIRPIMKKLSAVAERTGCAVVLIGHMNKASGMKSGYRGLGSIDFTAAARSILVVGRIQDEPTVRVIAQSKNSLAPEGKSIAFELDPEHGFHWKGACEITVDELLSGGGQVQTKTMQMEDELKKMLNSGEVSAETIRLRADELACLYTEKEREANERGEELSEYIFTNEHGKPIHPDTFSKTLRKIYDSIGLPHEFHLHTLRHYYVTTLLHSGVDKQTVADLVGHCDTSFLERTYCHPRLDKKRSAAEAFAAVQFGESIRSRP